MPSTPESVFKDLKNGKFAPVYFIQGEEPYFIDKLTHYIENHAIPLQDRGFNQVVMYGKDVNLSTVITNAKRFPMMADRQVVIVKEAQLIEDLGKESGDNLLISYLKNPLPSTILVFAHKYKTVDGRKALGKELDKHAVLVKSDKVPEYKLSPYIEEYIREKGFSIDPKASQVLAESIGSNLEVLTNEIDKMLINFPDPVKITTDHIQRYIGISKEYNTFELTKALSFRDVVKANAIIQYFAQNPKSNPLIPIITVLFIHFNRILLVYGNKNLGDRELAGVLKVNPFFVKEYVTAAKNYSLGKVIDIIGYLREADIRSKGVDTYMESSQILKELVFKVLH
ncbi:DNA polymerase III delta subunit [Lunatimonas lonarensis]|uniref:DNA polymerase III subunit delta n=1 Tax=Lunatimonas lonarensis TaxID=1232681 RepID=R7ZRH0_9BACT|nr:DNA polymerase III subunit delta [Lunatimonas lonarensis]EON76725.1 DNA polymerase III delta subunit [Lunatimonas lonarensis]